MDDHFLANDSPLQPSDRRALAHFKMSVEAGRPWQYPLLEAIAMWSSSEEVHQNCHYQYVINGEAFDWLRLAERLCAEVDDLIPLNEREDLLFHGQFPINVSSEEFQRVLGPAKHKGYLNHYYGVVVEEVLQLAIETEVRKAHLAKGYAEQGDYSTETYLQLYGEPLKVLLVRFLETKGYTFSEGLSYSQYKEFTYWLFKSRLKTSDPAKVASDTRKGLDMLEYLKSTRLN